MITEYFRPQTLDDALALLTQPDTLPLGGGTLLTKPGLAPVKVVDLQALGLNTMRKSGNLLEIGATATLQELLVSDHTPEALKTALKLEAPLNLRNAATVAGTLVTADGRSTFVTVLQALDAKITITGTQSTQISVGEFLPLRSEILHGKLITRVEIPLNVRLAFETVARTPMDKPIVCVALARWPSGRTRLALGGFGKAPLLSLDGNEADGFEAAARNSFHEATDEWGSAEYRTEVAARLAMRCIAKLNL